MAQPKRLIGIRHRRKKTREGEARPTMVAIKTGGKIVEHELADETAELDFLMGRLPVAWRKVDPEEDVSNFAPHHCKWKKADKEEIVGRPGGHIRTVQDANGRPVTEVLTKVPTEYEGFRAGDVAGMGLGSSGDRLAAALSKRGEEIDANAFQLSPHNLKDKRGGGEDTENDHHLLVKLLEQEPGLFHLMTVRDRDAIRVSEVLAMRQEAVKARIACDNRIHQSLVGRIFLNTEGRFPEGVIQDRYDQERANDAILQALISEEKRRDSELARVVKSTPIWEAVFEEIEGCGPRLAAGLIAPIRDIRRFWVEPDSRQMNELYQRSRRFERDGKLKEDLDKVAHRVKPDTPEFQILQMVRSWKYEHHKEADARLLDEAIKCHEERAQLRRKAHMKGMGRLKKFCGVHVNKFDKDGNEVPKHLQFPRRRRGQRSSWNPGARQALYLLTEQFNRRPGSFWGGELRKYKEHFRSVHPEVVEEEVRDEENKLRKVKRYTDGHIHKMACWRTATRFIEHVYKVWTKIEKAQLGDGAESVNAAVA